MNQIKPLDQVLSIGADAHNHITKVVNKFGSRDSILYKLKEFSSSVPDFRRSDKGNIRHRLDDIIMLMILTRASKCVGRTEIIEFGRHNLNKFRKLGMLKNGVLSEATLCRMEHGIDDLAFADRIKRKSTKAARNLDSIQRIVHSVFSIWEGLRKKRSDKRKGMAELMRYVSMSFTRLLHFLHQK